MDVNRNGTRDLTLYIHYTAANLIIKLEDYMINLQCKTSNLVNPPFKVSFSIDFNH